QQDCATRVVITPMAQVTLSWRHGTTFGDRHLNVFPATVVVFAALGVSQSFQSKLMLGIQVHIGIIAVYLTMNALDIGLGEHHPVHLPAFARMSIEHGSTEDHVVMGLFVEPGRDARGLTLPLCLFGSLSLWRALPLEIIMVTIIVATLRNRLNRLGREKD